MQVRSHPKFWLGFKTWTALFLAAQYVDLVLTLIAFDVFPPWFSEANPIALIQISTLAGFLGKLILPPLILLAVWKMREWKAYRMFLYTYTLLLAGSVIYNFALLASFVL